MRCRSMGACQSSDHRDSSFADRLHGDGGDGALSGVELGVAGGPRSHGEEVAVAEPLDDPLQAPAGEGHVGGGESNGQLLRWGLFPGGIIGREPVVQQLAGVEAVALAFAQDELDAGAVLLRGEKAFVVVELVHGMD